MKDQYYTWFISYYTSPPATQSIISKHLFESKEEAQKDLNEALTLCYFKPPVKNKEWLKNCHTEIISNERTHCKISSDHS